MKNKEYRGIAIVLAIICMFSLVSCSYKDDSSEFSGGFSTTNNGYSKNDELVQRLISVTPSERQLAFHEMEYYNFIHFGMNTMTNKEWGDGTESPSIFNPTNLDTDKWVEALQASGSKGVILTAKHHDGFCLWPSAYTEHSIKNSPYKNGQGDIVKELSLSCKKYGLKFGIYLSPWDRHEKTYGTKAYDDYYCNQLTELLTNYGEIFSVWMDGAKGEDAPDFEYDFTRYFDLVRKLQPNAVLTICGPDVRWIGNETASAREAEWSVVSNTKNYNENSQTSENTSNLKAISETEKDLGSREALKDYDVAQLTWYPAEADVSIRRKTFNDYGGWFYHENEKCKSVKELFKIYLNTAGNNASLLLNVPPTATGEIDEATVERLKEFGDAIKSIKANPISYTGFVGNSQKGTLESKDITSLSEDNIDNDYMLKDDEDLIDLKLDKKTKVNYLVIKENLTYSQRVEKFNVYYKTTNGSWKKAESCTVIGSQRIVKIDKETTEIRIFIKQSRSNPHLRNIAIYN